ncbi:MAG: acetyl-CoA carboxylase biotin carboxyl carrier protein subunit [Isosphaeraceae bacterium]
MKLKLTIDGQVYEVEVEVHEPEPRASYVPPPGQARVPASAPSHAPLPPPQANEPVADEGKVCRSPFSGTVSRVLAQAGQEIQVNDPLVVLEAMKMETEITAPIAGKVSKVNVNAGDPVTAGQVLIEFA